MGSTIVPALHGRTKSEIRSGEGFSERTRGNCPPLALLSKGKKHWLTIQHGEEYTILKMDKKNYRQILAAVEARTGMKVNWIIED